MITINLALKSSGFKAFFVDFFFGWLKKSFQNEVTFSGNLSLKGKQSQTNKSSTI